MIKLVIVFLVISFVSPLAHSMDAFEYQVYDSDVNKVGEFSLETHLNSNIRGKTESDYDGKLSEDHLNHLTFELARGMTPFWELGAYLQTALGSDEIARYAGVKLRSKFVVPRTDNDPLQLGLNFEVSNVPREFEENAWGSELRPIIGYTLSRFTLLFNPIIDVNLTAGKSNSPDFSPAVKLLFDTNHKFGIGIEYYSDLGEITTAPPIEKAEQYVFAALDLLQTSIELNLALGWGLNGASNPLVAKGILGFTF